LFDAGIVESEIITIKAVIDILLYDSGDNMEISMITKIS